MSNITAASVFQLAPSTNSQDTISEIYAKQFLEQDDNEIRKHFLRVTSRLGHEVTACPCCTIKMTRYNLLLTHLPHCLNKWQELVCYL